jgi:SNF2 family DNA or RNA helicase
MASKRVRLCAVEVMQPGHTLISPVHQLEHYFAPQGSSSHSSSLSSQLALFDSKYQPYLDALGCDSMAASIKSGQPILNRSAIKNGDPTAVLRLAALKNDQGRLVFPQFAADVLRLHNVHGAPIKLKFGNRTVKLFTHQLKALRFLCQCDAQFLKDPGFTHGLHGTILVLKMGLGKTLSAMVYAHMLPQAPVQPKSKFPTIVVASKTVMCMWEQDGFCKFFDDHVRVLYLHKDWMTKNEINSLNRARITSYDFVVTTYDVVLNLSRRHPETMSDVLVYGDARTWGEDPNKVKEVKLRTRRGADRPDWTGIRVIYGTPWKMVIADESQCFANPKTKTYRAMMGIYGYRKLCLTGTPIRNYKTDLWAQLRWMGYQGITKPQHWRPMYMINHNLRTCILTIDYPDTDIVMPPRHEETHEQEFSDVEACVYKFVLKKAQYALELMLQRKLNFVCVLALFTRLRQVCIAPHLITTMSKRNGKATTASGYAQDVLAELERDEPLWNIIKDKRGPAGMGSTKIQSILATINSVPQGEKVLVFSMFTSALDLIAGALDGQTGQRVGSATGAHTNPIVLEGDLFDVDPEPQTAAPEPQVEKIGYEQLDGDTKDRNGTMRRFKEDPDCKVMLITYKVGSEGLNLTEANHVILVEPWWTNAVPDQAMARAWRPGQTKPVTMHDLIMVGPTGESIEKHVLNICAQKKAMANSYLGSATTLDESERVNSRLNVATLRRILRR